MFKSDLTDMGDIKEGSVVDVSWELADGTNPEDIVEYAPDCGCTAKFRIEGRKVVATFTETDVEKLTPDQKSGWYPEGKMPITKAVTVYFKDDKNLFIIDSTGKQVFNPEKKNARLTFIGYAIFN